MQVAKAIFKVVPALAGATDGKEVNSLGKVFSMLVLLASYALFSTGAPVIGPALRQAYQLVGSGNHRWGRASH
jgi:hypothetical protein